MALKPHQLASQKFHAKRKDAGWRKITVWLNAETLAKLDILRSDEGSLDKAIAYAVKFTPTHEQLSRAPDVLIGKNGSREWNGDEWVDATNFETRDEWVANALNTPFNSIKDGFK